MVRTALAAVLVGHLTTMGGHRAGRGLGSAWARLAGGNLDAGPWIRDPRRGPGPVSPAVAPWSRASPAHAGSWSRASPTPRRLAVPGQSRPTPARGPGPRRLVVPAHAGSWSRPTPARGPGPRRLVVQGQSRPTPALRSGPRRLRGRTHSGTQGGAQALSRAQPDRDQWRPACRHPRPRVGTPARAGVGGLPFTLSPASRPSSKRSLATSPRWTASWRSRSGAPERRAWPTPAATGDLAVSRTASSRRARSAWPSGGALAPAPPLPPSLASTG